MCYIAFCDKNFNLWLNIKNRYHKFYKNELVLNFHVICTVFDPFLELQALISLHQIGRHKPHLMQMEFNNIVGLHHGQFYTLIFILCNDEDKSFSYFETSSPLFDEQLNLLSNHLAKQDTGLKLTISAEDNVVAFTVTKKANITDCFISENMVRMQQE